MPGDGCLGEIRMFAGNFAPRNWALCDGQLLPIAQYSALFSILGTTYGGDGRTTFGLPDLRGRFPMHPGHGPGLSSRQLGQKGGVEEVTLTTLQMPSHTHPASTQVTSEASDSEGTLTNPEDAIPAKSGSGDPDWANENNANVELSDQMHSASTTIGHAGGNQAHDNMSPFNCVNFIICLQGIFPSRN
ncbi:MAG: phage tail protein [Phycisphaerales bacterium]|nr:phage tail protein [Phycisphaerales bacterium]